MHFGARSFWRPLAGLVTILFVVAIVAVCANLFRGGFTSDVPVTVLSQRAGLVMNPGAKVKLHGVQVGRVVSIEDLPNGQAALHLAMDPSQLHLIPANVLVDITAPTVFGAKFVQLAAPDNPSPQRLRAGQVLDAKHVTVETNTLFEELTSVLSKIEPAKLNETLGALAQSVNGRGQKFGQALSDLDSILARLDPSLPNLSHELAVAPGVIGAYADAAPDLISTADSATRLSGTLVDEQHNLDALLVSVIGLADIGNQVLGENRQPLTDVLHLLVPSTDLTNQYNQALYCGLAGILPLAYQSPLAFPGIVLLAGFTLGMERYRYPTDLPKVAAKGRPLCVDLPRVPFEARAPYVVADVGMNPARYGNQGILLNSDALKQSLFGPIAGPPRNTEQFGMPG
ncbi:MCE family protein [Mycobacterium sp. 663a-19]|uniref:MCE family protein n=1 Tax=Mycobacterium sp. 663a-19 TaxID=2986148 RepID=UPI002D1E5486|nr:MCE family protein [Mycobacterium sp. 663a-19]MEB3980054.1 MCE family protein [Mycobacterium sp. 663a-19]